ncbi:hypothetical protein FNF27_06240 [Cafeteria roenbergensis]|uniref:RING-type domain-containing protein n=1 Tax=Cafeteria roenbergensis TaxID=33653 RepID=A0A5A8CA24_CAFRO|nr:hypothetical protein FNF29_05582 [Cafeteria roenbergensis]KAA0157964.1 hypothetical protein FNF31_05604 [Cafeteria roenbergensis]KAA0161904.1 hypothetical protein FNF28_04901 [Cafeteria roenbergensis]KAA0171733.1 hypothetical protein FNF27_06240 [Cafeteria roenbergensis]|eukprot:KAA0149962.1 hypothetical protein FNF29_05582 [Cafeteria roenbergensis]
MAAAASAAGAAAEPASGTAAKRFEVKKWNAVAFWSWDVEQDRCAICRNSIYEPSIEIQAAGLTDVTISWGECNHCFHLECISRWLRSNNTCPLCSAEWVSARVQRHE